MSRSIGDFVCENVGVISTPGNITLLLWKEITEAEIDENSKYIVVASDGVWEFLSNNQIMEIINPYYLNDDVQGACNKVVEESLKCWQIVTLILKIIGGRSGRWYNCCYCFLEFILLKLTMLKKL